MNKDCEELIVSAKKCAKWMHDWLDQAICECEGRHTCGKIEREKELVELESILKKIDEQKECKHPRENRVYAGRGLLRCNKCGAEFE